MTVSRPSHLLSSDRGMALFYVRDTMRSWLTKVKQLCVVLKTTLFYTLWIKLLQFAHPQGCIVLLSLIVSAKLPALIAVALEFVTV